MCVIWLIVDSTLLKSCWLLNTCMKTRSSIEIWSWTTYCLHWTDILRLLITGCVKRKWASETRQTPSAEHQSLWHRRYPPLPWTATWLSDSIGAKIWTSGRLVGIRSPAIPNVTSNFPLPRRRRRRNLRCHPLRWTPLPNPHASWIRLNPPEGTFSFDRSPLIISCSQGNLNDVLDQVNQMPSKSWPIRTSVL